MNVRVKDPLWPMRDLADFSFSVKAGKTHTLWMDTRDRVLPEGQVLYLTLAGAGKELSPEALSGSQVRLVYKPVEKAKSEHELDRFTQIRDLFGFTVEERPSTSRLNLYNRFVADYADLMKVNPDHWLGKAYKYAKSRDIRDRPEYTISECPEGIPEWAWLQVEYLRQVETIVSYYMDHRQVSNGEFGGGLSDDDDFSSQLVAAGLMGIEPEKIGQSLQLFLEGYYDQDRDPYNAALRQRSLPLFTNGLATITTDLLHAYEEGVEAVGQLMLYNYGNPLYMSRGMEIAKRVMEDLTEIAPDGHRHFRSSLFGGTAMSLEDPWQWTGFYNFTMLHTPYLIARYNGNPLLRQMIIELADGLLEHQDTNGNFYTEIHFTTGEVRGNPGLQSAWQVFLAAYEYTGDSKYLPPVKDNKITIRNFNTDDLISDYTEEIKNLAVLAHPHTVGSIWIDRIYANTNRLQTDRLGGVALARIRQIYPQHYLSWKISEPADYHSLAFFVPAANSGSIELLAYNLEAETVHAKMKLWNIQPGTWRVLTGPDTNEDQQMDQETSSELLYLERGSELNLSFVSQTHTLVSLELVEPARTAYSQRADLAISSAGLRIEENKVTVRVYSQGGIASPESSLELKDARGELVANVTVPAMEAPLDLSPNWLDVEIPIPADLDLSSGSIEIDPGKKIDQITRLNTRVAW
jgi:hypothetical protein